MLASASVPPFISAKAGVTDCNGLFAKEAQQAVLAVQLRVKTPRHNSRGQLIAALILGTCIVLCRGLQEPGSTSAAQTPSTSQKQQFRPRGGGAMSDPVIVSAKAQHSASVIWLHGLGDSGHGWASHAPEMKMPWVKWIFPSAPNRAVTINNGAQMPAWADIKALSPEAPEDEEGIMQTRDMVHKLIADEVASGIPPARIAVGGFSQGGAMAGFACLTHGAPLGGCFVLSGFLAMKMKVASMLTDGGRQTPFFQAHGAQDPVVPFLFGQISAQLVQGMVRSMEFKQYPMQHTSSVEELADLRAFLVKAMPEAAPAPIPDNIEGLSAKELKALLRGRGVDTSDCLEKADLVAKAKSLL